MSNRANYKIILPILFALVLILGIQLGLKINQSGEGKPPIFSSHAFNTWDELLNIIDAKYVDEINRKDLTERAVQEILKGLDPHSFYISQEDLTQINESLSGNFEGIGVEFQIVRDTIQVVSPIAGGPSEALGILSGDKIVKIEDSTVAGIGITNRDVMNLLRGERGSKVSVKIKRPGIIELLSYQIERDKIPINSVDTYYMVDEETGYIKVSRFSANTYQEFADALDQLIRQGMNRLMVDFRQNPGGYLTAATKMVEEFIEPRQLIVYTEGRAYRRTDYRSSSLGLFETGPVVVLIDEGSASASEIFAGALQDWDRGLIVGRRSFGKGSVQEQYTLSDGSAIRLTIAKYYTPSGRSIQKPFDETMDDFFAGMMGEEVETDEAEKPDQRELQTYFTSRGRKVYGGGGIMPDVEVRRDTSVSFMFFVRLRNQVPVFIYENFSSKIKPELDESFQEFEGFKDRYRVSQELFNAFIAKAEEQEIDTDAEKLQIIRPKLETWMKAYIARQQYGREKFYELTNSVDEIFLEGFRYVKKLPADGSIPLDLYLEREVAEEAM